MDINVIHALLSNLMDTQSPDKKYNIILKFYASNNLYNDPLAQEVLQKCEEAVNKKKAEGSSGGSKHKVKKSVKKDKANKYDKPMFVTDYRGGDCRTCKQQINSHNAFRFMQPDGTYWDYHAIPECFPEEKKTAFATNWKYIRTIMAKQGDNE